MIWKILTGVLGVALLFVLLFWFVPDLRSWGKSQNSTNKELSDSLKSERTKSFNLANEQAKLSASLARIEREFEDARWRNATVVPNVKLEVSGLSAIAQRQSNLENLILSGYLKPPDTAKVTPVVTYNVPTNEALTIKLRVCDSMQARNSYVERGYAALKEAYRLRGDSLKELREFTDDGKDLAQQKGWFTGRNKRLRQHAKTPPF
ncbi:hypothetical protein GCM10028806_28430 [Spirosoma terrae]|uniref:Uncharacterized protein n=1 Tax=Spirosoma terrae TaxID=1968276 RepID=A0A6L9LCA5_9BACT|nr:hypothetical protein [Spirosoma terrae]NDU97197.1 hypothetical protein [Spirosoma terrae]